MEDIKIYLSPWKNFLLFLGSIVFVAMSVYMIPRSEGLIKIVMWIGLVFFGASGGQILYLILRQLLMHIPYYVITAEGVIINSGRRETELRFDDVDSFSMMNVNKQNFIVIHYKHSIEKQKYEQANTVGKAMIKFNQLVTGTSESLKADGVSMKSQQLYDLLCERLGKYKLSNNK